MASYDIHLAVGKRYIQKNANIKNEEKFYRGILAPDITDNKIISHYSDACIGDSLIEALEKKVNLKKYLDKNKIDTDYDKGVFLHLITDYIFYNFFFDKEYIKKVKPEDFSKSLYNSYDIVIQNIREKYGVNYNKFLPNVEFNRKKVDKQNNILDLDKLYNFIEYVSGINLEKYKDKIIMSNHNILP